MVLVQFEMESFNWKVFETIILLINLELSMCNVLCRHHFIYVIIPCLPMPSFFFVFSKIQFLHQDFSPLGRNSNYCALIALSFHACSELHR